MATWTTWGKELGEQSLYSTGLGGAEPMVCGENPTVILISSEASSCSGDDESLQFLGVLTTP